MDEIGEKFLPIGSVVMLEGASKKIMITGFLPIQEDDKETMWDYSGCMYPEGFLSSEQMILFKHDQIENVYYYGLVDEEQEQFAETLKQVMDSLENGEENGV